MAATFVNENRGYKLEITLNCKKTVHYHIRICWFQLLHLPQKTRNWCKRPVLIF